MNLDEVVFQVARRIEARGLACMLVGGYSSNYYGIARSTQDADFVIALTAEAPRSVAEVLGPEFEPVLQISFETNTGTLKEEFYVRGITLSIGARSTKRWRHSTKSGRPCPIFNVRRW